ncbi:MAG TPA: SDR family NAD(P)-dependent oxidoreductase [Candidatus Saccharimonadales bacterium]|nr:SDR family NAD(P)-dependent oxidoreductase [Candidatus Saccharimonadales bacterium]
MNIIVGGTHGLGQEIAAELRRRGQETFVVGRSYDETMHGPGLKADLSRDSGTEALLKCIEQHNFDGFYWVAGYGYKGDFAEQPDPHKMIEVNLGNVLPVAQAAWKKLLSSPNTDTHFVVISSMTGLKPRPDEAVYAATKHAQVGFTRSLGLESERLKAPIKVALFLPGGMHTPFWEGKEPAHFSSFLDPHKVAKKIIADVLAQRESFHEATIERGSL